MGIYSIKKVAPAKAKGRDKSSGVGIRASYLRVVGIHVDTDGTGKTSPAPQEARRSIGNLLIMVALATSANFYCI